MKFKLLVLTFTLFTFTISAFARPVVDSVGVENHKGKRVVVYKIKKKDTYYSIAHKYHIPVGDLQSFNDNAKMTIGHTIKVPTGKPFEEPKKHSKETAAEKKKNHKEDDQAADKKHKKKGHHEEEQPADDQQTDNTPAQQQAVVQPPVQQKPQVQPADTQPAGPPTQYKVSAGETLYSIAKRFNTTVDNIMKLNNMQSNTIQPGQLLNVRANATPPAPQAAPVVVQNSDSVVAKRDSTVVSHQDSANATIFHANANKFGIFEKDEKGVATWMEDDSLDPNKKLVLHRTAPIGTVIRITNPMTNRTTFAKVVGRFTDNEQTKDVIIVMTKNVAQSLGALDKRFQVSLSYGVPNEQ